MITEKHPLRMVTAVCVFALGSLSPLALAQPAAQSGGSDPPASKSAGRHEASAVKHVNDALGVVHRMESEPRMKGVLEQAKGVFIVPTYGRAALAVGGSGGAGVLLVKQGDGTWGGPAFYNMGSISIGIQAGAEGGPVALVLNNDKAVNQFMQKNNFSLSADSGLTVVNWAKMAQGSAGMGDVVAWTGTKGLFGDVVTIAVNDIRFNQDLTSAYFHQAASVSDAITGKVKNPQADSLKQAVAAAAGSSSTGGSESSEMSGGKK